MKNRYRFRFEKYSNMKYRFASRMEHTPRSFIREILKVTENPEIISFGGGLPNPALFPVEALIEAARDVLVRRRDVGTPVLHD